MPREVVSIVSWSALSVGHDTRERERRQGSERHAGLDTEATTYGVRYSTSVVRSLSSSAIVQRRRIRSRSLLHIIERIRVEL